MMKALQFRFSIPRYGFTKAAGALNPAWFYGPGSCVKLVEVPEPEIPGPRWVKLRSVYSGFCGSDLGAIMLHDSPTVQPFSSFPFTFGHENCSVVEEVGSDAGGFSRGQRVTIKTALGCEVRGIDPPCGSCSSGYTMNCENLAEGDIPPGMCTGFCAATGGGWGKYYLAHRSQVVPVPDSLSDMQVTMLEPVCSSLAPVMRTPPGEGDRVLVIGCGPIGLGIIACIRALGVGCHITAVEPAELNREKCREKGADEVIDPGAGSLFERSARITGARVYKPVLEKRICMGGYDVVFDCVGSTATISDSLRLAAGGATVMLIGLQTTGRVDWTPVWLKGLSVTGNLGHCEGEYRGEQVHAYDVAIDLVGDGRVDLTDLVTHRFTLDEYRKAIEVNMNKARYGAIKTVFDLRGL